MRKADRKQLFGYIRRFFKGPVFTRQKFAAAKRYLGYLISMFYEKINGLDYTMIYYTRDENNPHNSSYSKAPNHVLKRIFNDISYNPKRSFIDIGCGKGYVVRKAYKYPFDKVGGMEYTESLYRICCQNLKTEGLDSSYITNCDARDFKDYGKFNIYFMNNPFDEIILSDVAQKMYTAHLEDECIIYYLNPCYPKRHEAILAAGFRLIRQIPDKYESYFLVNVYSNQ